MNQNNLYYDQHTLFIKCHEATREQIRDVFEQGIRKYLTEHNSTFSCTYRINLVENREGESLGIAFVFLTDSRIYHLVLGRNEDGSERSCYIPDPTWVSPSFSSSSWADLTEEEAPLVRVPSEPLLIIPSFRLTEKQKERRRSRSTEQIIPDEVPLVIEPAFVTPLDNRLMSNILKAKNIPLWVTRDYLKAHFRPYASDSIRRHEKYIKGQRTEESYPFVNINEDRVAFIIFDPKTHDAQFALHMMKKMVVEREGDRTILFFSHSYRTGRDSLSHERRLRT